MSSAAEALLSARRSLAAKIDYFAEPSSKKLLPDLPPHAASYMRTLGACRRRGVLWHAWRALTFAPLRACRDQCWTWTTCW